jgi:GTP-binding protein EngB required for normal cell division
MSGLGDANPPLLRDAMQYLGADSRRLIQGIKSLENLNINTTLQLPKFVVVGDQSAGKSSIVEALCDISLPRSQGTCTR